MGLAGADGAKDILGALHGDGKVAFLLFDLVVGHGGGAVVRHGGSHDEHIGGVKAAGHRLVHLPGGGHRHISGKLDRRQRGLSVDQGHFGAPHGGGAGKGVAHLAGGVVGQVAHRVQCLLRGAGGHRNAHPCQILRAGDGVQDVLDQYFLLGQAPAAHILAGQHTAFRGDDSKAVPLQRGKVILRDGVFQHAGVHGGGHQLGALSSQHHGGKHIVRNAVRHFGNDIGGGGGD